MKCPGQDSRYWKPGAIFEVRCPKCGSQVEFFKDDTTRLCKKCGHRFVNPKMDFGCASYCPYAEQCLGDLPPELLAERDDLKKEGLPIAREILTKLGARDISANIRLLCFGEFVIPAKAGIQRTTDNI